MDAGKIYKHRNNTDVAFDLLRIYDGDYSFFLIGYWINIVNPNNPYIINGDNIEIKIEDLENWEEYDTN